MGLLESELVQVKKDTNESPVLPSQNQNHDFYIKLVKYFSPAFPGIPESTRKQLGHAAYLYFNALLLFDHILDSSLDKKALFNALGYFEESIKQLSILFRPDHDFWQTFDSYKKEYFSTILFEKRISKDKSDITEEEFEKLAAGKSVIAYAIVDTLNYLSNSPAKNESLYECLRQIHIGFQLNDDVDDFKRDLSSGQRTYAHIITLNVLKSELNSPEDLGDDFLYKYFFVSGTAIQMLRKAIRHYESAIAISDLNGLIDLSDYLRIEIQKCKNQIYEINLLLEKTRVKYRFNEKKNIPVNRNGSKSIDKAVQIGLQFVDSQLDKDFMLSDFLTTAGVGKNWITAYAAFALAGHQKTESITSSFKKSKLFNGHPSADGSFNQSILSDGDSMSFLAGSTQKLTGNVDEKLKEMWLSFQRENGGWCTYTDEPYLRQRLDLHPETDVSGWTVPKNCVSASSCYILSFFPELSDQYVKTTDYLLQNMDDSGRLTSYWWTSPVYATSFMIMALSRREEIRSKVRKSVDWLLKAQCATGVWRDEFSKKESPFYTALALNALMHYDKEQHKSIIASGIQYLISKQASDGSWESSRILAIPATDVRHQSEVLKWRNSSFGVNILVDDHYRLFSTTTILHALLNHSFDPSGK